MQPKQDLMNICKATRIETEAITEPWLRRNLSVTLEFFLNNTNLSFLAFLYQIDNKGFQNQQK